MLRRLEAIGVGDVEEAADQIVGADGLVGAGGRGRCCASPSRPGVLPLRNAISSSVTSRRTGGFVGDDEVRGR